MKIAITGATGFIGWRLANTYHESGHEVIALGRTSTSIEELRRDQLQELGIVPDPVDIRKPDGLADLLRDVDVVFHLAAAQHEANVPDAYFRDVNVTGTECLLEASIEAGVRRFVYGSTIGIYGSALDGEISDATEPRPENIYERTKLEAEKIVTANSHRIEVAIVRIAETYGPGDGRLLKLFKAIQSGAFFLIGTGENIHQLIFVDDLISGLRKVSTSMEAVNKEIVFAGKERMTTRSMCQDVASSVDSRLRGIRLPLWPFVVAAVVLETICRPIGIQPPLHSRRLDFFRKSFFFDTAKSEQLLDFEPDVSFLEGAKITAEWYQQAGLMKF